MAILSRFCRDGLGAEQSPGIVNFVLESVVPATVAIPLQVRIVLIQRWLFSDEPECSLIFLLEML